MEKISYKTVSYKNIKVNYLPELEGGGRGFGQEYIRVIREKVGKVDHVFEFCAGPGFIGFSLLAQGLCNRLTLADINPEAVGACQKTIEDNDLEDRVSVYLSDCLDSIPVSEKWDLVVSNPPHFWTGSEEVHKQDIRTYDIDFRVHRKFYQDIKKFLKPDGSVIIQENGNVNRPGFTRLEDFTSMIGEGGLEIVEVFYARVMSVEECLGGGGRMGMDTQQSQFYFIWSKIKTA